jgi:hypothetical protein
MEKCLMPANASARGIRFESPPLRWKGHLDQLLPNPKVGQRRGHHAALP